MKHLFLSLLLLISQPLGAQEVQVAIISINDFHASFARDDAQGKPGAAALLHTVDSLKRLYPNHLVVSAGDNFGGSFFYKATRGALLPQLFSDLGISLSALGNHEFDYGQDSLAVKWKHTPARPADWDLTYICANVRRTADGQPPSFIAPTAERHILLPGGKTLRVAFAGLIASSTPLQVSKRRIEGLTFDGRYPLVLDSLLRTPAGQSLQQAHLRLLLMHVGTDTDSATGEPCWEDADSAQIAAVRSPLWHGMLTGHSHKQVCGTINGHTYPVVQGLSCGRYVGMLLCSVDTATMQVTRVEPHLVRVTPPAVLTGRALSMQQRTDSLLRVTCSPDGTPIGQVLTTLPHALKHGRDEKYTQTELGAMVCQAYAEAYRSAAGLTANDVVVGCSHFGSIRTGFAAGPVRMLHVGEALPFSNALLAYRLTGRQLIDLVDHGLHNMKYGWIQTSYLHIERNDAGHVKRLTYQAPGGRRTVIRPGGSYVLVADEYMTLGGDGYLPAQFPAAQRIGQPELPATTDAFVQYLRTWRP